MPDLGRPGRYLTLTSPGAAATHRCPSLTQPTQKRGTLTITIKHNHEDGTSLENLMATDPTRMLTVTLPSDIWDHITDRLGDYADQAEERPWLGDCHDCDKSDPGVCPQHQEAAEYGARVRGWRDQIVDQLVVQTATTADLVRYTGMPIDTRLDDVLPDQYVAVRNLLWHARIRTLGDLARTSDADLTGLRKLGPGRLRELRAALRQAAKN